MPNAHPTVAPTVIGSACSGPGAGGEITGAREDDLGTGTQRAHPCASQEDTSEALTAAADARTSNGGYIWTGHNSVEEVKRRQSHCGWKHLFIMSCNVLYVKYQN
jgi:hypothetical protein